VIREFGSCEIPSCVVCDFLILFAGLKLFALKFSVRGVYLPDGKRAD
jgi:hypothetical protein